MASSGRRKDGRRPRQRGQKGTWACLWLFTGLLYALQWGPIEHVKAALVARNDLNLKNVKLVDAGVALQAALTTTDLAILAGLGITTLVLATGVVRHRFQFPLLASVLARPKECALLVFLIAAISARWCVGPGPMIPYDGAAHFGIAAQTMLGIQEGYVPIWSNYWYCGTPVNQFGLSLWHVVAGLGGVLLGDLNTSIKLALLLSYLASALGVYLFLRAATNRTSAGLVGAAAHSLSFQHTYTIAWAGKMAISLVFALTPFLFWAYERYRNNGRLLPWAPLASLLIAGLLYAHPAVGPQVVFFLLLYMTVRCSLAGGWLAAARWLVLSGVLALGMTLSLLAPGLLERDLIGMGRDPLPLSYLGWHPPSLEQWKWMLQWRNRWTSDILAYQGLSIVFLFLAAVTGGLLRQAWRAVLVPLTLCAAVAILTMGNGNYAVRHVYSLVFFLPAGAALFPLVWGGRSDSPAARPWLVVAALSLLILDLAPTTIQSPTRPDRWFEIQMARRMAEASQGHLTIFGSERDGKYSVGEFSTGWDAPVAVPNGGADKGAGGTIPFTTALVTCVASDLNAGAIAPETNAMLALWDVRTILVSQRRGFAIPRLSQVANDVKPDPDLPGLRAPGIPAVFSTVLRGATEEERACCRALQRLELGELAPEMGAEGGPATNGYRKMIAGWNIDPRRGVADALVVDQLASDGQPSETPATPETTGITIDSFVRNSHRYELTVSVPAAGYLRLSRTHYPHQTVLVDGVPVPSFRDVTSCVVVKVAEGRHTVAVVPYLSRFRVLCGSASLVTLLAGVILMIASTRLRGSPNPLAA